MFSRLSVHIHGGYPHLADGGGGEYPFPGHDRSWVPPSQVRTGGEGVLPSQVRMGDTPFPGQNGVPPSQVKTGGGTPFPGQERGYPRPADGGRGSPSG